MALASKTLGSALIDLKRYDEAEPHFVRALAIDEKRVAASPNSAVARLDLSFDLSLLATLRMNRGDYRGALEYWNRTIAARKALVDADANDARAKGRLAFAYLRSSSTRVELGDFAGGTRRRDERTRAGGGAPRPRIRTTRSAARTPPRPGARSDTTSAGWGGAPPHAIERHTRRAPARRTGDHSTRMGRSSRPARRSTPIA